MSCATVAPEHAVIGKVSSSAISIHTPSFTVFPLDDALVSGSFASKPSSAVASAPTSVTTVPVPADPRLIPCCESTPATVTSAISTPAIDVFG
jgi:hypothetical protein